MTLELEADWDSEREPEEAPKHSFRKAIEATRAYLKRILQHQRAMEDESQQEQDGEPMDTEMPDQDLRARLQQSLSISSLRIDSSLEDHIAGRVPSLPPGSDDDQAPQAHPVPHQHPPALRAQQLKGKKKAPRQGKGKGKKGKAKGKGKGGLKAKSTGRMLGPQEYWAKVRPKLAWQTAVGRGSMQRPATRTAATGAMTTMTGQQQTMTGAMTTMKGKGACRPGAMTTMKGKGGSMQGAMTTMKGKGGSHMAVTEQMKGKGGTMPGKAGWKGGDVTGAMTTMKGKGSGRTGAMTQMKGKGGTIPGQMGWQSSGGMMPPMNQMNPMMMMMMGPCGPVLPPMMMAPGVARDPMDPHRAAALASLVNSITGLLGGH